MSQVCPTQDLLLSEHLLTLLPDLLDRRALKKGIVPLGSGRVLLLKVEVLEETGDGSDVPSAEVISNAVRANQAAQRAYGMNERSATVGRLATSHSCLESTLSRTPRTRLISPR